MLTDNFAGVLPVEDFLEQFLSLPDIQSEEPAIEAIVNHAAQALIDVEGDVRAAETEDDAAQAMITYLKEVVANFRNKPLVGDTHNHKFNALDEGDHHKMPDITLSKPGIKVITDWQWSDAGTVIEAKHKIDILDKDQLGESREALKALRQLGKDARSLLMASSRCHVFVITTFKQGRARLFRFDRAGFKATEAFNWLDEPTILPTFLYRLYHPDGPGGNSSRMHGQDDTISIPTRAEKQSVYDAICTHDFYNKMYATVESATKDSLKIKAVRFTTEDNERMPEVVDCFTIGSALWHSDGLFSRATVVYRVILEDDLKKDAPPVYALKDVWRQGCRRPEVDFYDAIAAYRRAAGIPAAGMAECHGSVDLSVQSNAWNPALHITRSTVQDDASLERHHMRVLLTPVGRPLKTFTSTKSLVQALHTAVLHHQIAYDAGVLHRDISDGNVLFEESAKNPNGFLLDWDYAEFTPEGLKSFHAAFPSRAGDSDQYENIDKSLKDFTGTFPFVAIDIMKNTVIHGFHHDLESIYWLLVWMVLRHTNHNDPEGSLACSSLFDTGNPRMKMGWITDRSPVDKDSAMFQLLENLRLAVKMQNEMPPTNLKSSRFRYTDSMRLTYDAVLDIFQTELDAQGWPDDDEALVFRVPSLNPRKNETKKPEDPRRSVLEREARKASQKGSKGGSLKRGHEDDLAPVASTSSEGTTAVSDGSEPPKRKRVKQVKSR